MIQPAPRFTRLFVLFALALCGAGAGCDLATSAGGDELLNLLPRKAALRKGIVNKYYQHYASADGFERTARIRYHQYRLVGEDRLRVTIYGPDCRAVEQSEYRLLDSSWQRLERQVYQPNNDTITLTITAGTVLDWGRDTAYYRQEVTYPNGRSESTEMRQLTQRDTLIGDRPARIVTQHWRSTNDYREAPADRTQETTSQEIYVAGLGLYAAEYQSAGGRSWLELAEQLPYDRFAILAARVPERVGHIDPRRTLDRNADFALCATATARRYPYFMSRNQIDYPGGQRALLDTLRARIDPALLFRESGYLTFRFMINCAGEPGHFVTDEADLDYVPKAFPPETVRHLLATLQALPGWQPAAPRGEPVDSYAFLTFKLRNGAIVDLLP